MLNQSVKNDFIEEKEKEAILHDGLLLRIFKKVEPFEEELQKDVCNFSYNDIMGMYKTWNLSSIDTLRNYNSQLLSYTDFCFRKNMVIDSQNHFTEFGLNNLILCINNVIKNNKIITREDLLAQLNRLNNYTDCFIILSFFEGLSGQNHSDVMYAKIEDFDTNKKKLKTYTKREIDYSTQLYEYAIEANNETEYISFRGNNELKKQLENSPYIVKYAVNKRRSITIDEYQQGRVIYNRCRNAFARSFDNNLLTIKDLQISGELDFIQRKAKENNVSAYDYVLADGTLIEMSNQFNDKIVKSLFIKKYYDILTAN